MPDPERPVKLDGGIIPLNGNRGGFPDDFLDGLVPETRNGVDVWRAVLRADDASGDMLFHNAAGELFWTVPATGGTWSADWIARLHTPGGRVTDFFSTEQRYQELRARPSRAEVPDKVLRRSAWLDTRQYFRPSRVELTFSFILQDDLADYRSAAAAARSQAAQSAPVRSPAALTGLSLTGIACGTNGVTLSAAWPTNTVISGDALDIFFSRSLLPQAWTNRWWAAVEPAAGGVDITIPQSDLPPVPDAPAPACFTNIAPSAYDPGVIYTNIVCTKAIRPAVSGFFRLADLADTDGDGLTDAAETWTHGTNPGLADTDGDGLTDGAEISLGTSPVNPDTDGDGMPDDWEIVGGLDPLDSADACAEPDADGLPNTWEFRIGTDPLDSDTDGDGVPDGTEAAWWEAAAPLPWFDVSDGTAVLVDAYLNYGLLPATLPFPVRLGGTVCTNALLDVKGVAYFIDRFKPVDERLFWRYDNSVLAEDSPLTDNHFAVAAYWDNLRASTATPASRITVADVATNDARYCVIEYRNMSFSFFQSLTRISFQIVIPAGSTNSVYVRYSDPAGDNIGASATLGAQGPGAAINIPVSYNQPFITDGLTLAYHFGSGGSPLLRDTDGDGLEDGTEIALGTSPANPDSDGVGLTDAEEVALGTDPLKRDTDGDGMPDGWEVFHGFNPLAVQTDGTHGVGDDPDGDGLANLQESLYDTDPFKADTDDDGLADGEEITLQATWPCLDPLAWDSDGDMLPDGWEVQHGLNPCECATAGGPAWDSDGDGLGLFDEYRCCTSPLNPDTDGDGVNDGDEIPHSPGSCPNDASDNGSPTNCVTLKLTVGDSSGSESERWNLDVFEQDTGKAVYRHCDAGFGTPGSTNYALVKGKAYTFKLRWIATDPEYTDTPKPDFDWQAKINDSTAAGVYEGLYGTGAFIVEDPDTLLTDETHGNNSNITIGREGRIIVPKAEFDHAKVNTRNLTHADDDFPDYEHCVAEIWDSSREVNLEDFLTAESLIFKDCLDWYVDGTKQSSSILNYGSAPGNNEIKDYEVHVTVKDSFTICDRLILVIVPTSTEQAHNDWVTTWSTNTAWLAELPAAYSALASGNANPEPGTCATLYWDEWGVRGLNNYYHPGSAFDMRSNETPGGHGHQTCYTAAGAIITSGVAAGSADRSHHSNKIPFSTSHRILDVLPFVRAAQLDGNPVSANDLIPTNLNRPMMFEGSHLQQYLQLRPPMPNNKPLLTPGTCAP
jgi:hypothetical protein